MKLHNKYLFLFAMVTSFAMISCNTGPKGEKAEASNAKEKTTNKQNYTVYNVNPSQSTIDWLGIKPTGEHNGSIGIKEGELWMDGEILKGGSFKIDMNDIANNDLKDSPEYQTKLVNHLKSPDFFDVENHPYAKFEITDAEQVIDDSVSGKAYKIKGNLTITDITKNISFDADVVINEGLLTATAPQFIIDRTDWGIKYKSKKFFDDLKDKFINDEIGIKINLVAYSEGYLR